MDAALPGVPPARRRRLLLPLLVAGLASFLLLLLMTPVLALWAARWWLPLQAGPVRITACGPWSAPDAALTLSVAPRQVRALAHAYGLPRWLPLLRGMWVQGTFLPRRSSDGPPEPALPWQVHLAGGAGPAVARVRWTATQAEQALHGVTTEDLGPMHLALHLTSLRVSAAPQGAPGEHVLLAEGAGTVTLAFGEVSEDLPLARIRGRISWRLSPVAGGLQPVCHIQLDDLEAGGAEGGMLGSPATRAQLSQLIDQRIAHSLEGVVLPVGVPEDVVVDARILPGP